jgi:transcriptional regulator with XRE-family HTH domain
MLSKIIKNQRELIGWSQQEFADKAKLSIATICKIEKGVKPSKKVLTKILNALCLTIDDLLKDASLTDQDKIYLENKKYERVYYGSNL